MFIHFPAASDEQSMNFWTNELLDEICYPHCHCDSHSDKACHSFAHCMFQFCISWNVNGSECTHSHVLFQNINYLLHASFPSSICEHQLDQRANHFCVPTCDALRDCLPFLIPNHLIYYYVLGCWC